MFSHCTRLLTPFLLKQSLFPYIKLLLESIAKLPKYTGGWLYRGVSRDLCEDVTKYKEGQQFRWWGYTSCSIEADVAKRFSKPVCVWYVDKVLLHAWCSSSPLWIPCFVVCVNTVPSLAGDNRFHALSMIQNRARAVWAPFLQSLLRSVWRYSRTPALLVRRKCYFPLAWPSLWRVAFSTQGASTI